MHPRTSYLVQADGDDSAREPLLEREDYRIILPDAEPPVTAATTPTRPNDPSAPPFPDGKPDEDLKKSPQLNTPEKAEGYGLPTGYRTQYAGIVAGHFQGTSQVCIAFLG